MKLRTTLLFLLVLSHGFAQIREPAKWTYRLADASVSPGNETDLIFEVALDKGWYVYSTDFTSEEGFGPTPTVFTFEPHASYELVGTVISENSKEKTDDLLGLTFRYMDKSPAIFRQRIKVLSKNPVIRGSYEYQVCTLVDGMCIPGDGEFTCTLKTQ